jgi:uncharacterized protein
MNQAIQNFIQGKRIAVVGVSRNKRKFGNTIYNELKQRGYQAFAVNPSMPEIAGDVCYPDLAALKGKLDGAVLCLHPRQAEGVIRQAAEVGVRNVWLQQGAGTESLIKLGRELGLNLTAGKCILMYAPPVTSFHNFHRFFARLFGRL